MLRTNEDVYRLGFPSSNTSGHLNVFRHDFDALGMNCTEIRIFKESDEISFLKSQNSISLKPQVILEILSDFSDETLEGKLT